MIAFYVPSDEYGFLSNYSAHGFVLAGKYWPTVEHYFQAQKFAGSEQEERIRQARTPQQAKQLGHSRKIALRRDWEEIKIDVMRVAVRAKFETHRELRESLIATGDQPLVENSPSDYFWGCGAHGGGRNVLGELLMEVRASLADRAS